MRKLFSIVIVLATLPFTTHAEPRIAAAFISVHPEYCNSTATIVDACLAVKGTAKEEVICGMLKDIEKRHMATATINFDAPFTVEKSKLERGVFGKVEFVPAEASPNAVQVPAYVKMNVYGGMFCHALAVAGGNTDKALQIIATEISGQK